MPGSSKHDEQVKAWQKRRFSPSDAGSSQRVPQPGRSGTDGQRKTEQHSNRITPTPGATEPHSPGESVDRAVSSLPNRPEACPVTMYPVILDSNVNTIFSAGRKFVKIEGGRFVDSSTVTNVDISYTPFDIYEMAKQNPLKTIRYTRWQKFKSTLSLARWGIKTYRSTKRMANGDDPSKAVVEFPSYSAAKNHKRGVEGAVSASGGVVGGVGIAGTIYAAMAWWRSTGGTFPWPDNGDIGFATLLGTVLTPLLAYVAGRINNKAKYNADAEQVKE